MLSQGDVVDERYQVGGLLGRGGMADVFRATDTATGGAVALKVLRVPEGDNARRFRSEADTLGRLDHHGLVRLHGSGTHDGLPYLVLDLADGPTLAHVLADGPLGFDRTLPVGAQVAEALAHAHALGVVHRDVKPSNILFDGTGRARLADFGIARLADAPGVTGTGFVIGSAPYLAPEQVEGRRATPAADVYALGLVLVECLSGNPCYRGNQAEVAVARLSRAPVVPPEAPAWLHDVLVAMTARDPGRRPRADAVAAALRGRTSEPAVPTTAPVPVVLPVTPRPSAGPRPERTRRHRVVARHRPATPRTAGRIATAAAAVIGALAAATLAVGDGTDPSTPRARTAGAVATTAPSAPPAAAAADRPLDRSVASRQDAVDATPPPTGSGSAEAPTAPAAPETTATEPGDPGTERSGPRAEVAGRADDTTGPGSSDGSSVGRGGGPR